MREHHILLTFKHCAKIHMTKLVVLTLSKCPVQWRSVQSHRCAHHRPSTELFILQNRSPSPLDTRSPPLPRPHCSALSPRVWLLQVSHVSGVIRCLSFCDRMTPLGVTASRFIHASARLPFLRLNNIPLYGWTAFCVIRPLMDTGCFRLLADVNSAAVTDTQTSI